MAIDQAKSFIAFVEGGGVRIMRTRRIRMQALQKRSTGTSSIEIFYIFI
jgi:hypothetical protein